MNFETANFLSRPLQRILIAIAIVIFVSSSMAFLSPDLTAETLNVNRDNIKSLNTFEYNMFRDENDAKQGIMKDTHQLKPPKLLELILLYAQTKKYIYILGETKKTGG